MKLNVWNKASKCKEDRDLGIWFLIMSTFLLNWSIITHHLSSKIDYYSLCISIYLHSSNIKPNKNDEKKPTNNKTKNSWNKDLTKIVLLKLVQTDKSSGYIVNTSSISHLLSIYAIKECSLQKAIEIFKKQAQCEWNKKHMGLNWSKWDSD